MKEKKGKRTPAPPVPAPRSAPTYDEHHEDNGDHGGWNKHDGGGDGSGHGHGKLNAVVGSGLPLSLPG